MYNIFNKNVDFFNIMVYNNNEIRGELENERNKL